MAARARRSVRGFTPRMVMIASFGERPVPPKPPLSLLSEGGCGFGVEEGREGGRKRRRGCETLSYKDKASFGKKENVPLTPIVIENSGSLSARRKKFWRRNKERGSEASRTMSSPPPPPPLSSPSPAACSRE